MEKVVSSSPPVYALPHLMPHLPSFFTIELPSFPRAELPSRLSLKLDDQVEAAAESTGRTSCDPSDTPATLSDRCAEQKRDCTFFLCVRNGRWVYVWVGRGGGGVCYHGDGVFVLQLQDGNILPGGLWLSGL